MANRKNEKNVAEGHRSVAALMVLNVPYLKSYVRGFLFVSIDKNIDLVLLHHLFDHDPELRMVLEEIDELVSHFTQRDELVFPDASTLVGFPGRRLADLVEVDKGADDAANDLPPTQAALSVYMLDLAERLSSFQSVLNNYLDESLNGDSVELASKLNVGIQRLLNAKIVPLVTLLRYKQREQERASEKQWEQERASQGEKKQHDD